jgi:hypothetical protein
VRCFRCAVARSASCNHLSPQTVHEENYVQTLAVLPRTVLAILVTHLDPLTLLSLAQTCVRFSQLLSPADTTNLWRTHVAAQHSLRPDSVHGLALSHYMRWGLFYAAMNKREEEGGTISPVVVRGAEFAGLLAGEPSEYLTCTLEAALGPEALSRLWRSMNTWVWNDPPAWRVIAQCRMLATIAFDFQCNQCGTLLTAQPLYYSPLGCIVSNDDLARKDLSINLYSERPKCFDVPVFVLTTGEYRCGSGTKPLFRCSPTVYLANDDYLVSITNGVSGSGCCGENNSERLCSGCTQEVASYSNDCSGPVGVAIHASRVSLIVQGSFIDSMMWKRRLLYAHTAIRSGGRGGHIG